MGSITVTLYKSGAQKTVTASEVQTIVEQDGATRLTLDGDEGHGELRVRESADEINAMLRVAYEED